MMMSFSWMHGPCYAEQPVLCHLQLRPPRALQLDYLHVTMIMIM